MVRSGKLNNDGTFNYLPEVPFIDCKKEYAKRRFITQVREESRDMQEIH